MSTLLMDAHTADGAASSGDAASVLAALAGWAACDVNDLSKPQLDEMLSVAERVASFSQGWRVRVLAQRAKLVEEGRPQPSPDDPKPAEPLTKPGKSKNEQARDAAAARAVRWAPSFGVALEAGLISLDHVAALGRVRNHGSVPAHETALLCVAKMRTAEDFVKWLITWDASRDRDAGIDRTANQRARRRVGFSRDAEGLGNLFAALAPLDATTVENTLRQIANELFHASGDDGTTMTQRLADALVLMALRATGNGTTGSGSKPNRPTLVVICDEQSLRSKVEDAGLGYTLDGTPVPPTELRRLACNADILPAVMNGAGQILDFGRSRRLATDTQRLALLTMYGGCIINGCGAPAELIEIHHLTPYEHGGATDLDTMAPLCNRDHTRSHAEGWTYQHHPNGHIEVTTPNGTALPSRRPRHPGHCAEPSISSNAPPGALFDLDRTA
jgi:hypothetical protein